MEESNSSLQTITSSSSPLRLLPPLLRPPPSFSSSEPHDPYTFTPLTMIFPAVLLFALPLLANAIPQRQSLSVNPHLALSGKLINTRQAVDDCPTCTTFATTVADCLQLASVGEITACLCTATLFDNLNTCMECPAVAESDQYSDLVDSSSQLTSACADAGVTGLPAVDPIPSSTSSLETDSNVASDAPSSTADEEVAPSTLSTTAARTIAQSGITSTKITSVSSSKPSANPSSASSSPSASAAANSSSSGLKSLGGPSILIVVAGAAGVWAALI
ncbi:hypothetical protein BDY24DRAFT_439698 [Mrakia frigida]|uniref:uncharacterized protein n=1 Tax=Mrakia frigida TaxID=29902 RepID=UPI003FCC1858